MDSIDLRHINLEWYRTQVGYLSQTIILFDMTIAENIAYGDLSRSVLLDEIVQAAKNAHADEFINNLPQVNDIYSFLCLYNQMLLSIRLL